MIRDDNLDLHSYRKKVQALIMKQLINYFITIICSKFFGLKANLLQFLQSKSYSINEGLEKFSSSYFSLKYSPKLSKLRKNISLETENLIKYQKGLCDIEI